MLDNLRLERVYPPICMIFSSKTAKNDKKLIIRLKNCNAIFLKQVVDESDGILSIAENSREIPNRLTSD